MIVSTNFRVLLIILLLFCGVYHWGMLSLDAPNSSTIKTDIEEYLKAHTAHKKIYFLQNLGNAGDALIWFGTKCLLDRLHIKVDADRDPNYIRQNEYDVLLVSGGGNLVAYYNYLQRILPKLIHKFKQVIILPHSIQANEKFLKNLPGHVVIFCRELMSYNYCKQQVPTPANILLSDDMAFHSDFSLLNLRAKTHEPDLFAFRIDIEINPERKEIILPPSNKDISKMGLISSYNSRQNIELLESFLSEIINYEAVWTDRLHVAIGAFLLGKTVHLYDNSYGKNSNIYSASLSSMDKAHKIMFHGTDFSSLRDKVMIKSCESEVQ